MDDNLLATKSDNKDNSTLINNNEPLNFYKSNLEYSEYGYMQKPLLNISPKFNNKKYNIDNLYNSPKKKSILNRKNANTDSPVKKNSLVNNDGKFILNKTNFKIQLINNINHRNNIDLNANKLSNEGNDSINFSTHLATKDSCNSKINSNLNKQFIENSSSELYNYSNNKRISGNYQTLDNIKTYIYKNNDFYNSPVKSLKKK